MHTKTPFNSQFLNECVLASFAFVSIPPFV